MIKRSTSKSHQSSKITSFSTTREKLTCLEIYLWSEVRILCFENLAFFLFKQLALMVEMSPGYRYLAIAHLRRLLEDTQLNLMFRK